MEPFLFAFYQQSSKVGLLYWAEADIDLAPDSVSHFELAQ